MDELGMNRVAAMRTFIRRIMASQASARHSDTGWRSILSSQSLFEILAEVVIEDIEVDPFEFLTDRLISI